jgi:hypothetical protein
MISWAFLCEKFSIKMHIWPAIRTTTQTKRYRRNFLVTSSTSNWGSAGCGHSLLLKANSIPMTDRASCLRTGLTAPMRRGV